MTARHVRCLAVPALVLAFQAVAQVPDSGVSNSLGLRVGYSLPVGGWNVSPVNSSVNLIGGSVAFEVDLDFAVGRIWTLGIEGGYSTLNGNAWEEHVEGFGQTLEISGSFLHFALLLRPHLYVGGGSALRFELGPAVLFASGEEVFEGRTYPYDFLGGTSFGLKVGLEYYRMVSNGVALSLKAGTIYFPSATDQPGGISGAIVFVPVTAGIRFML